MAEEIKYLGNSWYNKITTILLSEDVKLESYDYNFIKDVQIDYSTITVEIEHKSSIEQVSFEFSEFNEKQISTIKNILKNYPALNYDVNLGLVPIYLIELLKKNNIELIPSNKKDVKVTSNLSDVDLATVVPRIIKYISENIDSNVSFLFLFRGIDLEDLAEEVNIREFNYELNIPLSKKFVSLENVKPHIKHIDTIEEVTIPCNEVEEVFSPLPDNPTFFEKKELKTKIYEIYDLVVEESNSITFNNNIIPVKGTDFYFFFDNDVLKTFITPSNNFLFYLKSKGSLYRTKQEVLSIPIYDEDENIVKFEEREGLILNIETVMDYFVNFNSIQLKEGLSESFQFLNFTSVLAFEMVKSLSFKPQVDEIDDVFYNIKYVPNICNDLLQTLIDYQKELMPFNFAFIKGQSKLLPVNASIDILSMFVNYFVYKIFFLKRRKIKSNPISSIFINEKPNKSVSRNKNLAKSLSSWLEGLEATSKAFSPTIRVEQYSEDVFRIHVDVINNYNPLDNIITLSDIFSTEDQTFGIDNKFVRYEISKQLIYASSYFPELKEIAISGGEIKPEFSINELLKIVSITSTVLDALGIKFIIPKELKNIATPKLMLKATLAGGSNFDFSSIFENIHESNISLNDIMNFQYEIAIGDERITAEEFANLVKKSEGIIKFKDQYVLLKPEEVDKILKKLEQNNGKQLSTIELLHSAFSGVYQDIHFDCDEALKNIINDFFNVSDIDLPSGLNGELRPYQDKGFKWLYSNTSKGFGSCMADDMGLGKTIQVISLLLKLKEENKLKKPALVICPTTLVGNWKKECEKFAPSLDVCIYHGLDRDLKVDHDVVVTTYGLLRQDKKIFSEKEWSIQIIDEAQNIKNPETAQSLAVKSINSQGKIAMTGTPIENKLTELWSIFDFINRGYLGGLRDFQKNYSVPIEKLKHQDKAENLKHATSPFILRRLKTDKSIISDLPDKIVKDEYCYLTKEQAALYEKVLQESMKDIEGSKGINRRGNIFKLITSLKQICNHPAHYTKRDKLTRDLSGKTNQAISIVENVLAQNEKVLLFTQYKEMGDLLVKIFENELNITPSFFNGSLARQKREDMVNDFQENPDTKVMIISLKAGGTGLNLTAATNVIHYDLWWNPAVENQATDRTYRIGQTENVMVHRLVTMGTFEEKIDEMIKSKKELADMALFTGEKMLTELSDTELVDLFGLTK